MNNSAVEMLENQQEGAKKLLAHRDMAIKLSKNREFKKLILDEFCVQECARYAQQSGDPALTAEQRADALAISQAAGHLRRWLSIIVQMGASAESQMSDLEDELARARAAEEAGEDFDMFSDYDEQDDLFGDED